MSLELVPESQLPEWSVEDEELKNEFEARMNSGTLHLVSAKKPDNV